MKSSLEKAIHAVVKLFEGAGLWWSLAISVAVALISLLLATVVIVGWSPGHFKLSGRARLWEHQHPFVRALGIAGKNLAGVVLLGVGLIMALPGIPGQGILTMIIGFTLVDFPGKRRLERRLISRPAVLRRVNQLRARFARPPLELD